jgi:hypothetical protein
MLSVIMLSVIMLNVVMPSVIILNVAAPMPCVRIRKIFLRAFYDHS